MSLKETKPNPIFHLPPSSQSNLSSSLGQGLNGGSPPDWRVDDNELAADFDGSFAGLGVDLAGIPYNMSDALLALPVFNNGQVGFQYVLAAPTSPATKMNEETLTYLNQGQPYEVKTKKIGNSQGSKYYKSFIKVYFHERRLQFTEKEQIDSWINQRPGERILEVDAPLSYGIIDYRVDPQCLNVIEFLWDSNKDCGIFIKVNCISTEFTPKKHGGEKGVPFRIQIDTYSCPDDDQPKLLNCSSCQIKVFKPKGADRKHKTDRDKVDKLSRQEKEKYQPSYDCTVLTEVPLDQAITQQKHTQVKPKPEQTGSTTPTQQNYQQQLSIDRNIPPADSYENVSSVGSVTSDRSSPVTSGNITRDSSSSEVIQWLKMMRFTAYLKLFQNFSGADMLTLTREELIQICGIADGLRLNNALQSKKIRPRLTIYVNIQSESVFHAIYLNLGTSQELIEKLAHLFHASPSVIVDIHLLGANNIHILVTDEVVQNMPDNSQYVIEVLKNESAEQYRVLLSHADTMSSD